MTEPSNWQEMYEAVLKQDRLPYVIKDGKVYADLEGLVTRCAATKAWLLMYAMGTNNLRASVVADGVEVVREYLQNINSELLRREADAMLNASQEGPSEE